MRTVMLREELEDMAQFRVDTGLYRRHISDEYLRMAFAGREDHNLLLSAYGEHTPIFTLQYCLLDLYFMQGACAKRRSLV